MLIPPSNVISKATYSKKSNYFISEIKKNPRVISTLTFRHRACCILGQAFRYSPEKAFYIFKQQIYFII